MQTVDAFRVQYSRSSDAELAQLAAAGAENLRPEAWQALNEELQRRRGYGPPRLTTTRYAKAPIGSRFVAYLIDMFVAAVPAVAAAGYAFSRVSRAQPMDSTTIIFVVAAVLWGLYYGFAKDGFEGGQSFGKKALDLMVVNIITHQPCSLGESFVRGIIQTLLGLIPVVGIFIEPIAILVNDDGRRLGDRAAGTQVIETRLWDRTRAL